MYDPIDGSPPTYPVPGILQARTLEWVSMPYHIFIIYIYISVDRHLHCFSVLTIINSGAMNIEMHMSFQIRVFFKYMPRIGIASSYGSSTFGFLRPLHSVLLWSGGSVGKEFACTAWKPRFDPDELQSMGLQRVRHDWVTNTILFSKVAAPIYIPTNSVEEFLFLHTLSSICYL